MILFNSLVTMEKEGRLVNRVVWSNLADEAGIELKMLKERVHYNKIQTRLCLSNTPLIDSSWNSQ